MSDRIDTEAVKEWARKVAARAFAYGDEDKRIAPIAVALCSELDRTREAAERVIEAWDESTAHTWEMPDAIAALRAALAEGDTERPDEGVSELKAATEFGVPPQRPNVCVECGWRATDTEEDR